MTSPIETNNVVERLIARLRERPSQFECATYKALQAGLADKHQQQAAASGIALSHARFSEAADLIQSLSDRIDVLEGEKAALEAALSPKRAHHEIARIKKLARDPEVAAYIDELEACWRYQQDRTDAWRGIASAMGYEPRAHNDVKPTSPWILARIAKFRASLTQGGKTNG